jgi:DNA-binding transcriptional LysR family regulator
MPLPILTWPGDDWMIRTLTKHGLTYKIVFNSPDYHAKLTAAEAGIGFTAIPESMVPSTLVKAKEYYLPALPPIRSLLCARAGLETDQASALLKSLSALFFKNSKPLGVAGAA